MPDSRKLGPYVNPHVKYGAKVLCVARGEVTVAGISDAPIPWPVSRVPGGRSLVLFKSLVRAARQEAACAVAHWWGVSTSLVNKWRRVLGVPRWNEGGMRVKVAISNSPAVLAKLRDPQRGAKIAAAKRGKPRPQHVAEQLRTAWLGKHHSKATRRKMSQAHKQRGTWPSAAGRPWEPWEDRLVRRLSPAKAAERTGRTQAAVSNRRHKLGLADGRRKKEKRRLGR